MKTLGAGALALVALAGALAALWPVPAYLFELWMDSDRPYSHGLLVGPISIWLVARVCRNTWHAASSRSWLALWLFVGTSLCWIAAYAVDILIGQQILFPLLLLLAAATAAGWPIARKLAFPIGFLYFAIPIWSAATATLQALTIGVVGSVLNLAAIPLYVEGNLITIPEGVFEVAGGCAGLHFFIVALTIASLHAYLSISHLWGRVVLIGAATLIALVTNWFRVGSLVAIGHFSDMQHYLITHEHYWYGWGLFAIALVPLFLIARRLTDDEVAAPGGAFSIPATGGSWRLRDTATVGSLLAALALLLAFVYVNRTELPRVALDVTLPEGSGEWRLTPPPVRPLWEPSFEGADGDALASYVRDDARVDVYLAVYLSQAQGRELIGDRNRVFAVDDRSLSVRSVAVPGMPRLAAVREQIASSPAGSRRVVWYWYVVGTRLVVADLQAKLWQAVGSVWGADSGAVVAISAPCGQDCSAASGELQSFLAAMGESLVTASVVHQAGSVR